MVSFVIVGGGHGSHSHTRHHGRDDDARDRGHVRNRTHHHGHDDDAHAPLSAAHPPEIPDAP